MKRKRLEFIGEQLIKTIETGRTITGEQLADWQWEELYRIIGGHGINIPPALADHHRKNFVTLQRAQNERQLALVSALRADGSPVALVCAIQVDRGPTAAEDVFRPVPFAEMIEGNPYERYRDPTADIPE